MLMLAATIGNLYIFVCLDAYIRHVYVQRWPLQNITWALQYLLSINIPALQQPTFIKKGQ